MTESPQEEYAAELREILELRGVPAAAATRIVREVQSHVTDSGEDPTAVFGTPSQYADNFAPTLRMARLPIDSNLPRRSVGGIIYGLAFRFLSVFCRFSQLRRSSRAAEKQINRMPHTTKKTLGPLQPSFSKRSNGGTTTHIPTTSVHQFTSCEP